ncbi:MAG: alpha/beta fold hydrolase [Deltaproteobacteria bacterium]|nr:alpha/beta fold hydrolase [Deltaproteobacteria bacterium]
MNKTLFFCALSVALSACQTSVDDGRDITDEDREEMSTPLHEAGQYDLYFLDSIQIEGSAANRTVNASVCAPADATGELSNEGPFPLVIISPGAKQSRDEYMSYCEHLATWGFFVIAQDIVGNSGLFPPANHKKPAADVSSIIDWATSEENPLAAAIDGEAIGVAGHSMGGKVAFLAAAEDPRIGAIVGWDPVDANGPFTPSSSSNWSSVTPQLMPQLTQPIALIGETLNSQGRWFRPACAPADQNFEQFYDFAEGTALSVDVFGADHMDWTDSGSCSPCSPCGSSEAQQRTQLLTRRLTTAWFLRHLTGDQSINPEQEMAPELEAGQIAVQSQ